MNPNAKVSKNIPYLRPFSNRCLLMIFARAQKFIKGARILEIFAGSSSLGFRFILNKSKSLFVLDRNLHSAKLCNKKKVLFKIKNNISIYRSNVIKIVKSLYTLKFDIVFIDPPYHFRLNAFFWKALLNLINENGVLIYRTKNLKYLEKNVINKYSIACYYSNVDKNTLIIRF